MQIFSLSSLFPNYTHTHTHTPSFLQTGLGAILQGLQRESQRKASSSFLSSLPRISKPFVYLEPPFHYLETARFFFLSQQTFVWTKMEEETEGWRGVGSSIEVEVFPILLAITRPSYSSIVMKIFAVNQDWLRFLSLVRW